MTFMHSITSSMHEPLDKLWLAFKKKKIKLLFTQHIKREKWNCNFIFALKSKNIQQEMLLIKNLPHLP